MNDRPRFDSDRIRNLIGDGLTPTSAAIVVGLQDAVVSLAASQRQQSEILARMDARQVVMLERSETATVKALRFAKESPAAFALVALFGVVIVVGAVVALVYGNPAMRP